MIPTLEHAEYKRALDAHETATMRLVDVIAMGKPEQLEPELERWRESRARLLAVIAEIEDEDEDE